MEAADGKPSLILSSLDHLRKANNELRKENEELAEEYDRLIGEMECLRGALSVLKNIVDMGGLPYDRPDSGQYNTPIQEKERDRNTQVWDDAVRKSPRTL